MNMATPTAKFEYKWTDQVHTALLAILVDIVTNGGTTSIAAHKEKIMADMEARGFQFTWEATR